MEESRLLDVPITEREHRRRSSDHERLLSSSDTNHHARNDEIDPVLGRFKSLRTSISQVNNPVNNPDYNVKSPVTHQRVPSTFGSPPHSIINFDQPTQYPHQGTYARLDYPPELWRPFWVRRPTLGVLLVFFLIIVVGLVLLWHYSHALDGFSYSPSTTYYAWTYAPVAFMILVVSLWRQVDYYFKLLAPWDELRQGPTSAFKSILLDFVSPIHIVSLTRAFKRGYIPVILSITVFFCLKVITIFCAALLVPLPTIIISNSTAASSSKIFDASSFNPSLFPDVSAFSSDPVYSTLGNFAYGLQYPPGVRPDYAYIPVVIDSSTNRDLENATYTAETDALFPNLSCAPLSVSIVGNLTTISANRTTVNKTNSALSLHLPNGNVCRVWSVPKVYAMNPQREKTPPRQLQGTMQRVFCSAGEEEGSKDLEPAGLLFTLTDIRYRQVIFSNGTIANSTRTVSGMTNLLCIPGYYILKAELNNNTAMLGANAVNIRMTTLQNRTLSGLSKRNLAVLYEGIMNASHGIFGTRQDDPQAFAIPNTVFNLMSIATNKSGIEAFLEPKAMQTAAESTFRHVMSHYAAQSLTKPSQKNVTVNAVYSREKLHLTLVPFYVTIVCTGFAAFCTFVLMMMTPGPLVTKDPSLIAMHAAVLARSPELNRLLRKQLQSQEAMATVMSNHEFGTAIATTEVRQSSFKIVVSEAISKHTPPRRRQTHQWWSPLSLVMPTFILCVIASIALIVVLELLQRKSNADEGLLTVSPGPYTTLYVQCIPILVMLLIAGMISFLNFYVALLAPWNKLSTGHANAARSLLSHILGKLDPVAFIKAIQGRHYGAMFSVPATMIASVLAVVASGLYYTEYVTSTGLSQELLATGTFQFQNRYNVLNDLGAAGLLKMVDRSNATYPTGTYDELVFPSYSLPRKQNFAIPPSNFTVGPFTATVPALRANLRCDFLPSNKVNITYVPASQTYKSAYYQVDSRYDLPESCHLGGRNRTLSIAGFRNVFNVTNNNTVLYGGHLIDLVFGQNSSAVSNYGESKASTTGDNPSVGCPSLSFTFGRFDGASKEYQVTSLICYQQIQQLDANVTYKTNSTELDPSHIPAAIESSMSLMTNPNSTNRVTTFDWRIQRNINRQLFGLNGERLQSSNQGTMYQFDAFFSHLVRYSYKQDLKTLSGDSNHDTLLKAINTLYRRYMAQAINANMRSTSNGAANILKRQSNTSSNNVQMFTRSLRLMQNSTSKLILQILLGITIVFSILAFTLTKFHRLLPCNPCSIAGTMSLLAGSDLCWSPDDGLCDCCGKPRRSSWSHEHSTTSDETIVADPSEYQQHSNSSLNNSSRQQIIPNGAEWMDHIKFAAVFSPRTYSLGWWREDYMKSRRRRFGVDVGGRPDGENDDDWELGDRRPLGDSGMGFEGFMMRGRDMLGDQRGLYHRADEHEGHPPNTTTSVPIYMPGPGQGHGQGPGYTTESTVPPEPRVMSPRRVRFEDLQGRRYE